MRKYWIIVEGKPQGPFTPEQLKLRRDFAAELPVWTTGMADWTTAGQVAELSALLAEIGPAEETDTVSQTESEEVSATQADVVTNSYERPQRPESSGYGMGGGSRWVAGSTVAESAGEKMPSSYLGWNIAMTLCCCMPVGIAGIFFSAMVSQKWQRGDFDGARKASERAAWCLILSIVLGLVGWPFQMLFQMNSLSGL